MSSFTMLLPPLDAILLQCFPRLLRPNRHQTPKNKICKASTRTEQSGQVLACTECQHYIRYKTGACKPLYIPRMQGSDKPLYQCCIFGCPHLSFFSAFLPCLFIMNKILIYQSIGNAPGAVDYCIIKNSFLHSTSPYCYIHKMHPWCSSCTEIP